MMKVSLILMIIILRNSVYCSHFRGGIISWRPATNDTSVLNTKRTIIVDQRYAWSRSVTNSACTATTILSYGLIGESSVSALKCQSPAATCTSVQYTTDISTYVPCTDYNTALGMSFGHSSTAVNLTVRTSGVVLGYVVSGAWLTLQLGSGGWSMMVYINMSPRPDNGLINSSPTTDIQPIVYAPAGLSTTTSIDIPMYDTDGDDVECRFALSSNSLGGVTVDECDAVCEPVALPASTQLISGNGTCTLIVKLTSIGYYAVAIQIEDFLQNSTIALSSIPVQFLLYAYDALNPTSTCTLIPIITSIPPDLPLPGDTIAVQVTVLYTAMVIARTGCNNDTDTTIINFVTISPPGMLKSNVPFALNSPYYATNLTWTPTIDQLGKTFTFCATAIDSNYYSSNQYCFYLYVGPKTTTTSTTSTTSTSTTTTTSTSSTSSTSTTSTTSTSATTTTTTTTTFSITTVKPFDCTPLLLGLGLGLGIPLLSLVSLLALGYLCRWCPRPLRSLIRRRFGHRKDMYCQECKRSTLFDDPPEKSGESNQFRQQYINNSPVEPFNQTRTTSLFERDTSSLFQPMLPQSGVTSPSILSNNARSVYTPSTISLPLENRPRALSPPQIQLEHHGSILIRAYSKQVHPQ